jgi:hypothetical protein
MKKVDIASPKAADRYNEVGRTRTAAAPSSKDPSWCKWTHCLIMGMELQVICEKKPIT